MQTVSSLNATGFGINHDMHGDLGRGAGRLELRMSAQRGGAALWILVTGGI
jgi:hypothetical protein